MTDEEIIAYLKLKSLDPDTVLTDYDPYEALLEHLDSIFEQGVGHSPLLMGEMFLDYKSKQTRKVGKEGGRLKEFLDKFIAADVCISFWFSWMPFRFYLDRPVWENFVKLYNEKTEREYPEERWQGIKISVMLD